MEKKYTKEDWREFLLTIQSSSSYSTEEITSLLDFWRAERNKMDCPDCAGKKQVVDACFDGKLIPCPTCTYDIYGKPESKVKKKKVKKVMVKWLNENHYAIPDYLDKIAKAIVEGL